jgi:hypothetical protein
MRAIVVDSLAHSLVDLLGPQAYDPKSVRAFSAVVENWHGATEEDRARALPLIFATFKLFENAWFQQRQGTLAAEQWEGWDVYIRIYYHRPGVKAWWAMRKQAFAAGFRSYLETSRAIQDVPSIEQLIRGGAMTDPGVVQPTGAISREPSEMCQGVALSPTRKLKPIA